MSVSDRPQVEDLLARIDEVLADGATGPALGLRWSAGVERHSGTCGCGWPPGRHWLEQHERVSHVGNV